MINMSEIMNIQLSKSKNLFTTKINIIFLILLPICIIAGSGLFNTLIILIDLIFILELIKTRNNYILKDNNFHFLIIFFIYLIFNSLYIATAKDYPVKDYESITRSIGFLRFIILAYAIHFYFTKYENKILKYWFLIFVVVTFDIIFEFIFGKNIFGFSGISGRISSFKPDDLNIGGYYFGFIMICLFYLRNSSKKFFIACSIIFFITALLIGERSNFLKIFSMYVLFVLFFSKMNIYKKIIIFLMIIVVTVNIIINNTVLKSKFYRHIFVPIIQTYNENEHFNLNDIINRIEYFSLYNSAIRIFKENPTFGSGLKTFRYESYSLKKENISIYGASTHPHQIHFELLSEIGLFGYLMIILNLLNRMYVNIVNDKNYLSRSSILFLIATLIPILPSGGFFSGYNAVFIWINYAFLINAKPYLKSK